ncbi:MAG: aminotransferase class I/II-fold pyridoxal phosphate-dependent enzyme, partial [Thermoplasmata archaeon]|nr:aminotransferase class I/II-fold pyridoxal phosphate-dependent enzyme [Thermoplasmata archaeon]
MPFPLGEWIDRHAGVPHNLAQSGLKGTLPALSAALRRPEPADFAALQAELARTLGVASPRLFLTHGATEGNTLALVFLARRLRQTGRGALTYHVPRPEYPPLSAIAEWAGFARHTGRRGPDVAVCSSPNNPTGVPQVPGTDGSSDPDRAQAILIDETFREFTTVRSRAVAGDPKVWTTGTFTKVYGADHIRVGFVVAPPADAPRFAEFHGVTTDEVAAASVSAARAILRDRTNILAESRRRLERNAAVLRSALDGVPRLAAPVYFDRGRQGLDGDRLATAAARGGVLVCPGSYFDDPSGVRICLTQPSFPDDLAAYLAVRERWLDRPTPRASRSKRRRTPGRSPG